MSFSYVLSFSLDSLLRFSLFCGLPSPQLPVKSGSFSNFWIFSKTIDRLLCSHLPFLQTALDTPVLDPTPPFFFGILGFSRVREASVLYSRVPPLFPPPPFEMSVFKRLFRSIPTQRLLPLPNSSRLVRPLFCCGCLAAAILILNPNRAIP